MPIPDSIKSNIKHVVVMVMENRSFDHILGQFPGVVNTPWGLQTAGPVQYNLLNSESPAAPGNPAFEPLTINTESQQSNLAPGHTFGSMMWDIFGNNTQGYVNGQPVQSPPPGQLYPTQTMCGFVSNPSNANCLIPHSNNESAVMDSFQYIGNASPPLSGRLNALFTLAENFVICADWHCDTPAETVPNRYFMHSATNLGWNEGNPTGPDNPNNPMDGEHLDLYDAKTIYESLDGIAGSGINWTMYGFGGSSSDASTYDTDLYAYTNSNQSPDELARFQAGHKDIACFAADVQSGALPFYTFIMPSLNSPYDTSGEGNSMHPNSDIRYGENYVAYVYNILSASDLWKNTLFIVTFDENGGIYDHVMPPAAAAPDNYQYGQNGQVLFDYTILGPRVPALLVSPWLQGNGTNYQIDTNQYQHTSILRFVQDLFAAQQPNPTTPPSLTQRDQLAPSFAASPFWAQTLPTNPPPTIAPHNDFAWFYPYPTEPACAAQEAVERKTQEPAAIPNKPASSDAVHLAQQYFANLPGHPDSGKPLTRKFASYRELWEYLQERKQAARQNVKYTR